MQLAFKGERQSYQGYRFLWKVVWKQLKSTSLNLVISPGHTSAEPSSADKFLSQAAAPCTAHTTAQHQASALNLLQRDIKSNVKCSMCWASSDTRHCIHGLPVNSALVSNGSYSHPMV